MVEANTHGQGDPTWGTSEPVEATGDLGVVSSEKPVTGVVALMIYGEHIAPVLERIRQVPKVKWCSMTAGKYDAVAFVEAATYQEFGDTIVLGIVKCGKRIETTTLLHMDEGFSAHQDIPSVNPET